MRRPFIGDYRLEDSGPPKPRHWRVIIALLILLPLAASTLFFGLTAGLGRTVAINVCYTVCAGVATVFLYAYLWCMVQDVWADRLGPEVGLFTLLAWFGAIVAVGHMWFGVGWLWDPTGEWSANIHAEVGDLAHPGRHVWWVWWRTLYTMAQAYRGGGFSAYDAIGLITQISVVLISNTAVMFFSILVIGHALTLIDRNHKHLVVSQR